MYRSAHDGFVLAFGAWPLQDDDLLLLVVVLLLLFLLLHLLLLLVSSMHRVPYLQNIIEARSRLSSALCP